MAPDSVMPEGIVEIAADTAPGETAAWLARTEVLHRQLRPRIPPPYYQYLRAMMGEGAHLAVLVDGGIPRALAVWRVFHSTYAGKRFYVDDLVVDESLRGRGWGGSLIAWLEQRARDLSCDTFALDSGTQRHAAHRFYFRAGLVVSAFSFVKVLTTRFS